MATITSSTATPTPTPTPAVTSAAAAAKAAANSVLTSLGSGSGVDTDTLVTQLVTAQFAAKRAQITAKTEKLTAQISGASTLKSYVSDFAKAVNTLVTGGTLATQPNSSDTKVAGASAISGAAVSATASTTVRVDALASAQSATSSKFATPATTTFASGTLTLNVGTATYTGGAMTALTTGSKADGTATSFAITIDTTNNTLSGVAAAINAKNAGVTASVVSDADGGAYLSLKGQSGTTQAFTLTAADAGSTLAQLDVGAGASSASKMTIGTPSANARLVVDGVAVERASNDVSDLVPGVKLTLTGTGTTTLTGTRPETALTNAVKDFVDTFNDLLTKVKEQTNAIDGTLRADPAATQLLRTLQGFNSRTLLPDAKPGAPATLAAIGVRTNKTSGEMEIDEAALTQAMKDSPDAIEAMFTPNSFGATGINAAMQSMKLTSGSSIYGLTATDTKLRKAQDDLTKQTAKIDEQASNFSKRLTQQYASMNARVTAYKATQSFMTQQIDNWTKSTG